MEEAQEKHFEVTDTASAEWCMEKLAEKQAEREQIEEQYQKMISRYEKWRNDSVEKLDADEGYFKELLRPWAQEQLVNSKKKSVNLPSGRIGFRAGSEAFVIKGVQVEKTNADLLKFVKQAGTDFIEVKESVKWGDYKKTLKTLDDGRVVTADGEIIPDMKVEQGEPKFYVEVRKND